MLIRRECSGGLSHFLAILRGILDDEVAEQRDVYLNRRDAAHTCNSSDGAVPDHALNGPTIYVSISDPICKPSLSRSHESNR